MPAFRERQGRRPADAGARAGDHRGAESLVLSSLLLKSP